MSCKITLLKKNSSNGRRSPDQIVVGVATVEDKDLEAITRFLKDVWVSEQSSFEVSHNSDQ